jgi:O-antigen/teichoic acid export membrane protein
MSMVSKIKKAWQEDSLLRLVVRNSGYLFSSNTVAILISMVQSILAAWLLGVSQFGLLGTITVFASFVNRLFSFKMSEVVVRYFGAALSENDRPRAAAVVKAAALAEAGISILAFLVLLALSPQAAVILAKDPSTASWFAVYGLSILGNLMTETSTGVLQVTRQFRNQAAVNLGQAVLTGLIIVAAYLIHGSFLMVLLAYLVGKMILGCGPMVLAWRVLHRELGSGWWRQSFAVLPAWRGMARFAVTSNLSATINLVVRDSELLWVAYFLTSAETGSTAVGYFKVALAFVNLVIMPIDPFIATTYPEINRGIAGERWQQVKLLLRRVTVFSGGWTGAAVLGLALFGGWLVRLYDPSFGLSFQPAYPALMVLLAGYGFANVFFWNRSLLLSLNRPSYPFRVMLICGALKVGLAFLLVPRFGYLAEAGLLSGYFILSNGLILWRGLLELRHRERLAAAGGAG